LEKVKELLNKMIGTEKPITGCSTWYCMVCGKSLKKSQHMRSHVDTTLWGSIVNVSATLRQAAKITSSTTTTTNFSERSSYLLTLFLCGSIKQHAPGLLRKLRYCQDW
jgi:hypothetical protein